MNPPQNYTLKELAEDVRALIDFLHKSGVIGLEAGIDFHTMTIVTGDGQLIDVSDEIVVDVPEAIIQKIRSFNSRK